MRRNAGIENPVDKTFDSAGKTHYFVDVFPKKWLAKNEYILSKQVGKKGGSFSGCFWGPFSFFLQNKKCESSEKVFFDQQGVLFEGSRFRGRFIVKHRFGRSEKRYCCNSWRLFSRCFLLVKNLVLLRFIFQARKTYIL